MIGRRAFLAMGLAASAALHPRSVGAARFEAARKLKPGEFIWEPERAPAGSVVLIVSIPEQMVHVYRGGIEIGASSCATGRPGHRTPTGLFTILEKERRHVSSIYKGAQMPNMERLTWTGIALHAGNLPGYPASHGCIRLPIKFSSLLYEVTHLGVVVIIADERTQPESVVHPGLMLSSVAEIEARAISSEVARKAAPGGWDTKINYPMTSLVVSRADGMAVLAQDGRLAGKYPIRIADQRRPLGTHVYSLVGPAADGSGLLWLAFGIGKSHKEPHIVRWQGDTSLQRISFYDDRQGRDVAAALHPGATVMVTDASAPRTSRSTSKDFSVISSEPEV